MDIVVNAEKEGLLSTQDPLTHYFYNILLCLGYEPAYLPLANLIKLYHQLSGHWLVASPIHWEATHNDAMLTAAGNALQLSEEESRLWFAEVATFLSADGFTPVYHDAQTWLFKVDDKPPISSQAVETVLHQSLMPLFTSLDRRFFWQRLITELQMYLSAHPLNAKRQGLSINGLWFWGGGEFECQGRLIATDDAVLLGYARASDQAISPLGEALTLSKDHLVIINDPKQIECLGFKEKTKKKTVNWHWNNGSYSEQVRPWWSRILRYGEN